MLKYFLYVLIIIIYQTNSELLIRDAGVTYRNSEDITIFFYLTLENTCEKDLHISVNMVRCIENLPCGEKEFDSMYLIGGDMGILNSQYIRNVSLLYPNLYLKNRIGKCLISIIYQNCEFRNEIVREIHFNTTDLMGDDGVSWFDKKCTSSDQDSSEDCLPVDCTIKYSSARSYFDKTVQRCVKVPMCYTNFDKLNPNQMINPKAYFPISNKCKNFDSILKRTDMQLLKNYCRFRANSNITEFVNYRCHHGQINNNTGLCECYNGWTSRSCSEDIYEPNLSTFHMCNIEISSWTSISKYKVGLTVLVFFIFVIAIAAKIFLAICLLNLCYKYIRPRRKCYDESSCAYKQLSSSSFSNFSAEYIPVNRCIKCSKPKRSLTDLTNRSVFIKRPPLSVINNDGDDDESITTENDLLEDDIEQPISLDSSVTSEENVDNEVTQVVSDQSR